MIRLAVLLLLLACPQARAEVARVTSGEHAGYSRLLVTTPRVDGWQLTRTPDGYALDAGAATTGFDLSQAFDRIPRTRVTALFADPADGRLRIRVGCACHAIAFLHEGRYLVVDVRDGPAPERSSFEQTDDGTRLSGLEPAIANQPSGTVAPRYDWLASRSGQENFPAIAPPAGPVRRPDAQENDLRLALLAGITRGAAAGVIGLTLPEVDPVAMPPGVVLFNGGAQGVALDTAPGDGRPQNAALAECPSSERFAVGTWATDDPFFLQFSHHRRALLGEFDRPDPAAVDAAVRFHLHLGFGAEAQDLIRAFPEGLGDRAVWAMMAAIMEGDTSPDPAFADWMVCDTAAALWATLALPPDAAGRANRQALRQAFGTLPPHLRSLLAPPLRERALLLDDAELAASIAATAMRGAAIPGGARPADTSAAALLATWRSGGAHAIPAALSYVAAAHSAGTAVPAEVPGALLSLSEDYRDLPEGGPLARAGRLSAALAGDFDTAFADTTQIARMPELWQLLVESPDDDAFIAIAIARRAQFPEGHPDLAEAIAARFVRLRLPELALAWLPAEPAAGQGSATAAAALVDLGRGREALRWLDGLPAEATNDLRARAADLAGEHRMAAEAWAAAGDAERASRSARLAGMPVQPSAETAWQRLARDAAGAPLPRRADATDAPGALRSADELVAASSDLRADIGNLLSDTALPEAE